VAPGSHHVLLTSDVVEPKSQGPGLNRAEAWTFEAKALLRMARAETVHLTAR